MPIARRLRVLGALIGVFGAALVGCGASPDQGAAWPSPSPSNAAFPVTIEHRFGSTTI